MFFPAATTTMSVSMPGTRQATIVPQKGTPAGFSPESMRFLGELAQARGDGVDLERASATWSTTSFTSYHGQLLSLAVQWGVAIEIERSIHKRARFA